MMMSVRNGMVQELEASLEDVVARPGSTAYEAAMSRLFFADASLTRPLCVVQARRAEEIAAALRVVRRNGGQLTVRGGGCSALCAADGAVLLDMAAHYDAAELTAD